MPFKKGEAPKNSKPFPKGVSGNPNGRPKDLPEIKKLLADVLGEEKDGVSAAEAILKAIRAKATKGDIKAAELLLDRAYGKSQQKIDLNHSGNIAWHEEKTYEADKETD
jgi:hypothetical protein